MESNSRLEIEVEALKIQLQSIKAEKEKALNERDDLAVTHQRNLEVRGAGSFPRGATRKVLRPK